ncbi:hypothetical protein [Halorarius litoreus]|uniref:hypothetical protein n=1 Tax=Halorarius litoreus TaxID=2962676 RepID=UPI0020CC71C1|nr:hypothetical protein [Halorarius litoreus]
MRRRALLAVAASSGGLLAGCLTGIDGGAGTTSPRESRTRSSTPSTPSGHVENHRTTDVAVESHHTYRRDDPPAWIVTVTLELQPVGDATPYPIGLFVYFFDAEGDQLHDVYKQVPANTSGTTRTATRSAELDTDVDAFDHYRIDVVHA